MLAPALQSRAPREPTSRRPRRNHYSVPARASAPSLAWWLRTRSSLLDTPIVRIAADLHSVLRGELARVANLRSRHSQQTHRLAPNPAAPVGGRLGVVVAARLPS